MKMGKRLIEALMASVIGACSFGCAAFPNPMKEARLLLESPAGQKLVDRMNVAGAATVKNPTMRLLWVTGVVIEADGIEYTAEAAVSGEVTDDERGVALPAPIAPSSFWLPAPQQLRRIGYTNGEFVRARAAPVSSGAIEDRSGDTVQSNVWQTSTGDWVTTRNGRVEFVGPPERDTSSCGASSKGTGLKQAGFDGTGLVEIVANPPEISGGLLTAPCPHGSTVIVEYE